MKIKQRGERYDVGHRTKQIFPCIFSEKIFLCQCTMNKTMSYLKFYLSMQFYLTGSLQRNWCLALLKIIQISIPSAAKGSPAQVLHLFLCNESETAWLNFCNISLPAQQESSFRWKAWIRTVTNWLESQTESNRSRPFYDKEASVSLWCWV